MTADERRDIGAIDPEDHELLTALLDGELDAEETARVRAWLERDPAAQLEFEGLATARAAVRDLGPVEPPFGFFELLERRERRSPRRRRAGMAGAIAATAAAAVLVVGFAPNAAAVVPEVGQYATRHATMVTSTQPDHSGNGNGFVAMPADQIATMPAPYQAPPAMSGGYEPIMAFHGTDDVVHVMYEHDGNMVSVFEQPGKVKWSAMPPAGTPVAVPGGSGWMMQSNGESVMVVERSDLVYTVVAEAPPAALMGMAAELPEPAQPSIGERLTRVCESFNRRFGLAA